MISKTITVRILVNAEAKKGYWEASSPYSDVVVTGRSPDEVFKAFSSAMLVSDKAAVARNITKYVSPTPIKDNVDAQEEPSVAEIDNLDEGKAVDTPEVGEGVDVNETAFLDDLFPAEEGVEDDELDESLIDLELSKELEDKKTKRKRKS